MRFLTLGTAALLAAPLSLSAQFIDVIPHSGTLGLGVDAAYSLSDVVSVRGGLNFQPWDPEAEIADVTYTMNLPSPSAMATVDLHPGGRSFRFSGGFVYFGSELELDGVLNEAVEIGDTQYTPAEVGTLTGSLVTNAFAPYIGIGVGNTASGTTGFFMDAGLAFHGTPDVALSADGSLANDPQFQADLDAEASELRDDLDGYKAYPVLSFGARIAVG